MPTLTAADTRVEQAARHRAEQAVQRRSERYRRRSILANVGQRLARSSSWAAVPFRRCASCGVVNTDDTVSIKVKDGSAYTVGLSTCGSVWMCAVCAAKVFSRRAVDVQTVSTKHCEAGGSTGMMTLTIRHNRSMTLQQTLSAMTSAWKSLQQSADWRILKEIDGLEHQIRTLEITHGWLKPDAYNNGWHPHFHVLLFWNDQRDHSGDVEWIARAWAARIEARLGVRPDEHGFDYTALDAKSSKYVSKIANEMTRADLKGSASIWQLLDELEDGETWVFGKVMEYYAATKGQRAIVWSRGLRDRYGMGAEKSDEELVADIVDGETVDEMSPGTWRKLCRYRRGRPPLSVIYLEGVEQRWRARQPPDQVAA